MKYIIEYIVPIAMLVLAFYFNNICSFSLPFSFIPIDKKVEVSIGIWIAIINLVLFPIKYFFYKYQTILKIIVYKKGEEPEIKNIPKIKVARNGPAEIKVYFDIKGHIFILKRLKLVLNLPDWLQAQSNVTRRANGSYEYIVVDLFEIRNMVDVKTSGKANIPLIGMSNGNKKDVEVLLKIEGSIWYKFLYKVESNSVKLEIS